MRIEVGVGVVVADAKVLVCRRRDDDAWGGYWEFPGGKCEAGESAVECVRRELREELGIEVHIDRPLPPLEHFYAERDRLVKLLPFLCRLANTSPPPRAIEVAEHRWCDPRDLPTLRFLPANGPLIRSVLEALEIPRLDPAG